VNHSKNAEKLISGNSGFGSRMMLILNAIVITFTTIQCSMVYVLKYQVLGWKYSSLHPYMAQGGYSPDWGMKGELFSSMEGWDR